jgi:hypothetical protein
MARSTVAREFAPASHNAWRPSTSCTCCTLGVSEHDDGTPGLRSGHPGRPIADLFVKPRGAAASCCSYRAVDKVFDSAVRVEAPDGPTEKHHVVQPRAIVEVDECVAGAFRGKALPGKGLVTRERPSRFVEESLILVCLRTSGSLARSGRPRRAQGSRALSARVPDDHAQPGLRP